MISMTDQTRWSQVESGMTASGDTGASGIKWPVSVSISLEPAVFSESTNESRSRTLKVATPASQILDQPACPKHVFELLGSFTWVVANQTEVSVAVTSVSTIGVRSTVGTSFESSVWLST